MFEQDAICNDRTRRMLSSVNKILSYYYESSLSTSDKQPVWRVPLPGVIKAVYYYRDNTSAPTVSGTILIKKNGTTIYTVTIGTSDSNQTWISSSTTPTTIAAGDKIEAICSATGTGVSNITVQVDVSLGL